MRAFPHPASCLGRAVLACLLLGLAAWSHAARADMYRCQGAHGETVFTGHPEGYTHCKAIQVAPQKPLSGNAAPAHRTSSMVAGKPHAAKARSTSDSGSRRARVLRGAVYRVVHADGSIEYTNVKPRRHRGHKVTRLFTYIDVCAACALHSSVDWATVPLHVKAYGKAVRVAAAAYGVKPAFLRAIIHAESAFNPNAVSNKGAQGLMQLMPGTASDLGVADAFDAAQNIRGGAQYLAQLLKDFHGDRKLAAAAYNAGPQAVRKYKGVPPYAETRVYVKRVSTLYHRYAKALGEQKLADTGQSS
ncbi:MAG TPA: lytic transglycosylase domain-containing protein [Rhodanobacteraceae bacterium]|nr:lytic transglycosylase domain-containing protein [Rhodanobacteraceae bacterium]